MTRATRPQAANANQELRAAEKDLARLSKRIDGPLRRRYATREMWRAVRARPGARDAAMLPSAWTLLALVLAWCGLQLIQPGAYLLAWWPPCMAIVVAIAFEFRVLPWVFLARYDFRLMRLERMEQGEFPHVYTVARMPDSNDGFGTQAWRPVRDLQPGDIVMSLSDSRGQGVAIAPLHTEVRLAIVVWASDRLFERALPPVNQRIEELVEEFDAACERHHAIAVRLQRSRALRSATLAGSAARDPDAAWKDVVLDARTKKRLRALAASFREGDHKASRGLLLHGAPGTGKTLVARAMAQGAGCAFFPLTLPDLKAAYVGQSGENVKSVWHRALAEPQAVIFVDECDGVFARRGGTGSDSFSDDIVNSFIAQWDGFGKQHGVWVIAATNRRDLIDPAVLSRFDDEVEIGLPGAPQRLELLAGQLRNCGLSPNLPDGAGELTAGMSGRDLAALARRLARELPRGSRLDDAMLTRETRANRRRASTTTDPTIGWDALVLPDATMRELKTTAGLLQHADVLAAKGIAIPRAMLLHGPPGTGKTQAARVLAKETGLTFIAASTADLKAGYLGQSGQRVRELFERAREASPSLLFIDEIDVAAARRDGDGDAFAREIVGQLLQEMDGVKFQSRHVFVLAATNHLDRVDPAVLSRMATRIEIPLPDAEGVVRILRLLLRGKPLGFDSDGGTRQLATVARNHSGRDLKSWVERAEQRAVMRAIESGDPASAVIELRDFDQLDA